MDNDTNFFGDQLRLASFLRVVENMPQRPSRFRRVQQQVDPNPPIADESLNIPYLRTCALNSAAQPWQSSRHQVLESSPILGAESGLATFKTAPLQGTDHCENTNSSLSVIKSGKNISQTTKYPLKDDARQDSSLLPAFPFKVENGGSKSQPKKRSRAIHIRKRRSPANGLALLRTTTEVGLPLPSDLESLFVRPIADTDPIEDSQLVSPTLTRKSQLQVKGRNNDGSKPSISSHNSSPARRHVRKSLSKTKRLKQQTARNSKNPMHIDFTTACDGFIGVEFIVPPKKPKRRAGKIPKERKETSSHRSLLLANGYLPTLPIENMTTRADQEMRAGLIHSPPQPTVTPPNVAHSTELTICQSSVPVMAHVLAHIQTSRTDNFISNQLSGVTAPARHDSESSGPEEEVDTQWSEFDEAKNDIDGMSDDGAPRHSGFAPLARVSTVIDDYSYFENAVHHLDAAENEASTF